MFEVASVSQSSLRPLRPVSRPSHLKIVPASEETNWQSIGQAASLVLRALQPKFDSPTSESKFK